MTEFSIVVPVYNVQNYIQKCILSIQSQTFDNFEVILIDDCGNDSSVRIAQTLVSSDSRFKLIKHNQNLGTGISRNDGIDEAKGKYLCFLDPDDWLEPDYLAQIYDVFENNPDINWVWFKFIQEFDKSMNTMNFSYAPKFFAHSGGTDEIITSNLFDFPIYCWTKSYRLKWLKDKNIRYAQTTYEEFLFYVHCVLEDPKFYLLDKRLYHYLSRAKSWTTSKNIEDINNNIKSLDFLKWYIPKLIRANSYDETYISVCIQQLDKFYNYQMSCLK